MPESNVLEKVSEGGQSADPARRLEILRDTRGSMPSPPKNDRDFRGARLDREDLSGLDLSAFDFSGASLVQADLSSAQMIGTNLSGANLFGAKLDQAELLKATLSNADLTDASAVRTGFGGADLSGARLLNTVLTEATLTHCNFSRADARAANFDDARMVETNLTGADFSRASMRRADLQKAQVEDARFRETDLRGARLRGISGYATTDWIQADIVDTDFCNAYLARREILDQNYLYEFRNCSPTHSMLYKVWWATSDCGRSFLRWSMWTALIAFVFAWVYTGVGIDFGPNETVLSPFYFSVVTLTTLGYGDVLPNTISGQVAAMIEVILGYVMLGGLLSIFSNKMARRAE